MKALLAAIKAGDSFGAACARVGFPLTVSEWDAKQIERFAKI
jgi:hypothetical protein